MNLLTKRSALLLWCWSFIVIHAIGQNHFGFKRLNPTSYSSEDGINVIELNDGGFVALCHSSPYLENITYYKAYKIDQNSFLVLDSIVIGQDTSFPRYGAFGNAFYDQERNEIISAITSRTNYQLFNTDPALVRFNLGSFDTVFYKKYQQDSFNIFSQVKVTENGSYILAGEADENANKLDMALTKVSIGGDILWQKYFGTDESEFTNSVNIAEDGGYYILGSSLGYGPRIGIYTDALLIKTDSLGNEEWRTTWGGYFSDCAWNVEPTPDGGIVACGCVSEDDEDGSPNQSFAYVRKMNKHGKLLWDYVYPNRHVDDGGRASAFTMCRVLDNGNIVTAGSGFTWRSDSTIDRRTPWAMIFSPDGEVLADRAYTSIINPNSSAVFQDIRATSDGGFIAGGTYYPSAGDTGNQDAFILKLDERGCEFPECRPPLSVSEFRVAGFEFLAYPNPASGELNLSGVRSDAAIQVIDALGRQVNALIEFEKTSEEHIRLNISQLPSGVYFIRVINEDGNQSMKFVKD